jgi:hypothetical protein
MDKIFASRPGRIRFLLTIGLLVLVLVFIRYWLLPISFLTPHLNEIAISLSEKFITALVSAVIVGWFLYWVQADEKKKAVDFTESKHQIEKYLTNARKGTNFWYFNGGLGRYSKSDTIPLLSKMAADENRTITLDLIVINPFNKEVVNKYVDFRKSLVSEKEQRNWSYEQAQNEILATIVTAFYYKRKNQFLRTSIRIKNYFSLSRMDISDSTAVITRENSSFPSIVALKGSHIYQHYLEEFQQVSRQSMLLEYTFPTQVIPTEQQVADCVKTVFPNDQLPEETYAMIYQKFRNPKNPFE